MNAIPYTKDAYEARKYAFVSDYARFKILYAEGGLYFDTDVEVIKPMEDIIEKGAFMGWETANDRGEQMVAPGLCLGAPKEMLVYREILDGFEGLSFYDEKGEPNKYTMIPLVTDILKRHGMEMNGLTQTVGGITIYSSEYFCPMDSLTGKVLLTPNTRSIHWYSMSWLDEDKQKRAKIARLIRRLIGTRTLANIKKILNRN